MQLRGLKPNMTVIHVTSQTLYRITRVNIGLNPFEVREVSKQEWLPAWIESGFVLIPLKSGKFLNRSLQILPIQINDLYFKFR